MDAYVGDRESYYSRINRDTIKPKIHTEPQVPKLPKIDRLVTSSKNFEEDVHAVFTELEELLLSKHHDYGPKNIADAPGGAHNGLRVRLYDKLARLSHWFETKSVLKHETAEESYKDVANYGVIGLLVSRGLWPNE